MRALVQLCKRLLSCFKECAMMRGRRRQVHSKLEAGEQQADDTIDTETVLASSDSTTSAAYTAPAPEEGDKRSPDLLPDISL